MTTNQTIDGVSREGLELALGFLDGYGHEDYQRVIADELRALLEAPAKLPVIDAHNERLIASLRNRVTELEAAQPQGEPVAWDIRWSDNGEFYFTLRRKERLYKYADDPDFKVVPLYAERPAPVAVK